MNERVPLHRFMMYFERIFVNAPVNATQRNGLQRVLMGRFSALQNYDDIATGLIARAPSASNRDATHTHPRNMYTYTLADQHENDAVYVE